MKRIIFIRENMPGGINRYCQALYHQLKDDNQCQAMPIINYPDKRIPFLHYYYHHKPLINAIKQADIVHINGYTSLGTCQALWLAWIYGKRIAYTAHWHPFRCLRHPWAGWLFFNVMLRLPIRYLADVVFTINKEDTTFFKHINKHTVQLPHWFIQKYEASNAQHIHNRILFVGRLNDPVKGIDHLQALPQGKYDIHCVGRGDIPLRKDITQYTDISDEQLSALYASAALTVIPSKYEAFSYTALESLLHGTPVVMSDQVRIADYLHQCNGISIFKYGDKQQFKTAVEQTIGTTVNVKEIEKIFAPEQIIAQYKANYLK